MPSLHAFMACTGTTLPLRPLLEEVINKRQSKQERSSDTESDACKPNSRACGCLDISKCYKTNIAKKQVPVTLLNRPDPLEVFFLPRLRNS
jgi:hypothetical protein